MSGKKDIKVESRGKMSKCDPYLFTDKYSTNK